MTLSAFGMSSRRSALPPVAGALFQEAIDVAVILNALRALSGGYRGLPVSAVIELPKRFDRRQDKAARQAAVNMEPSHDRTGLGCDDEEPGSADERTPPALLRQRDTALAVRCQPDVSSTMRRPCRVVDSQPAGRDCDSIAGAEAFLRSDRSIRTEILKTVVAPAIAGGGAVEVEVVLGLVQLRGEIGSGAKAERLIRLIRDVPGVVGVESRLSTRPAPDAA
jgi:hypothetical protein